MTQQYTRNFAQPYTRKLTRLYTRNQLSHTREFDSANLCAQVSLICVREWVWSVCVGESDLCAWVSLICVRGWVLAVCAAERDLCAPLSRWPCMETQSTKRFGNSWKVNGLLSRMVVCGVERNIGFKLNTPMTGPWISRAAPAARNLARLDSTDRFHKIWPLGVV